MFRIAIALFALSLAACNGTPPSTSAAPEPTDATPAAPEPATDTASTPALTPDPVDDKKTCDADKVQSLIGKTASQEVVDQATTDSGSSTARVIQPGQPVTMDFREDRLNVEVDAGNVIQALRCG